MCTDYSWSVILLYIHQCLSLVLWSTEVLTEGFPLLFSIPFSIVIVWTFSADKHMDGWMDGCCSYTTVFATLFAFHLFFGVSSCQTLSSEAVETVGPMHIPIATKGHENFFVALRNHKRVDGCMRCASKVEYLICILGQHSPKKWNEVSSCSPHAGHNGSSWIFATPIYLYFVSVNLRQTGLVCRNGCIKS